MKLVFRERIAAQGNVTRFVFQPETPLSWQPGQYIHYDLPHPDTDSRGTERWFTISSAPFEKEVWITTRIFDADGSSFKRHLLRMEPGQAIEADLPEGDFIVEDPSKSYVFVAGGIGITPFRSILKQLHHDGKSIKVELLYANRDAESIAFKDELEAISKAHDGFSITYYTIPPTMCRDPNQWSKHSKKPSSPSVSTKSIQSSITSQDTRPSNVVTSGT
jgi:ferredoxin-NADP reductase